METTPEFLAQEENLADLHSSSLRLMALFAGAVGFAWFIFVAWPETGGDAPPPAWAGSAILLLVAILSYLFSERYLGLASVLFVAGTLVAAACVPLTLRSMQGAYVLLLPIIFGSLLLDQRANLALAGLATLFTLAFGLRALGLPFISSELWLPVVVIVLVASASWLSARNLYTALDWVWSGYEQAHHNEQLARQGQAELRRALKALDEATYRLERANHMLALARDQAEEARRLKQQFAQTISHELRTPLNLIVGFTELMAQSPEYYGMVLSPAYMRDLSIVHRNARHLQTLVNDVLDLARIEAAQLSLLPEETNPETLVQEAVSTARSLVEARGLTLLVDIEPGLPRLWVDPTRIRQVLFNLLNNAARFTERGGVTVTVRQQGEEVVFAVADTGVGIAPEDVTRIFDEFQQADGSTRRRHEGAGLGLAISRQFVELHGGRIWVESQVGRGSTFSFSLPVRRTVASSSVGSHPATGASSAPVAGSGSPVLLTVSRSPAATSLLARYVRGTRAVAVPSLEQARSLAPQLMPQVVVIDSTSEPLDPATLEGLAHEWGLPRTPFLACPLPGEESLRQRLAVDGYLIKPVSRASLWDALRPFGERIDRVLVVDDDRDFVLLVGRMLEDSPLRRYQVLSAASGREGLAMVQHRQPDLMLLDLMLPDIDGFQVIERIRALPGRERLPIIVVSAQDELDSRETLHGALTVAKAEGLKPADIVRWVQNVVDAAITLAPEHSTPPAAPARKRASRGTR